MPDYTMIRVKKPTRERLGRLRAALEAEHARGNPKVKLPMNGMERPYGDAEHVSLDWLINYALDRLESHRERARRSGKRRKHGKAI